MTISPYVATIGWQSGYVKYNIRFHFATRIGCTEHPWSSAGACMSKKRNRVIDMPAPYLRRVWLDPSEIADREAYPFCLPFLRDGFELEFDRPITIIAGENGTGKSTLLEGIAVLSGFDDAGGAKGYRAVDHSDAKEVMGGQ